MKEEGQSILYKNRTILYFSNVNMSVINHILLITNLYYTYFLLYYYSLPFPSLSYEITEISCPDKQWIHRTLTVQEH